MRIFTFCLFYFFLCIATIYSQSSIYEITGKVLSKNDSSEVVNAIVQLHKDKKITDSALTDAYGFFRISCSNKAELLSISYLSVTDSIRLNHNVQNINLGNIFINIPTVKLNDVIITAKKSIVRYDGIKAVYNLDALPNTKGSDLLNALEKIPGIQHTNGDGLKLNGFRPIMVLIDKRPIRMDKMELENYLSSLSISEIASVELIQNPGGEYSSDGAPVINIVTKKHLEDGYSVFANSRLSYQKYMNEYVAVRLNLNKGISRSYISYSFGESRSHETTEIEGISLSNEYIMPRHVHQLGMGTRLNINIHNSIDINLNGSLYNEKFFYDTDKGSRLLRPHIYYAVQHKFDKDIFELLTLVEGSSAYIKQNGIGKTDLYMKDYSNFIHINPLLKYKTSKTGSIIGGISYDYTNYLNRYISNTTSFKHYENHTSALIGFSKQYKNLNIHTEFENHFYQYGNDILPMKTEYIFLPRFIMNYQFAKNHQISIGMQSRAKRPDFRDITPVSTHGTASWMRVGNPDVLTSKSYEASLKYTFMGAAQLELNYSDTDKPIVEQLIEKSPKNIIMTKSNLDNSRYIRALVVLPIPIIQNKYVKWFATSVGAFQRQWDKGNKKIGNYTQSFNTYYIQHKHSLHIGDSWSFGMSVTRYGSLYFGLYKMQPMWWFDVNISKRIEDWRITVSVYDPFNTNLAKGSYETLGIPVNFVRNWHLPRVSLGVSYSLGNKSLNTYKNGNMNDNTSRMRKEINEGVATGVGF